MPFPTALRYPPLPFGPSLLLTGDCRSSASPFLIPSASGYSAGQEEECVCLMRWRGGGQEEEQEEQDSVSVCCRICGSYHGELWADGFLFDGCP
eukprot:245144-Hanusia_phi.AAC.3